MDGPATPGRIRTPDQRLRVFVSSTLGELAAERQGVRAAIEQLRLTPVMFELGARPHPPRALYRSYLDQSDVFVGIYWQRYGWVAPDMEISGLEDEYVLSAGMPRLVYVKRPAPEMEPRLEEMLDRLQDEDTTSYKPFTDAAELERLLVDDLALMLTERFDAANAPVDGRPTVPNTLPVPTTALLGRSTLLRELDVVARRGRRPAGDPDRAGRHRQDPARGGDGRCTCRPLPRRRLLRRPQRGTGAGGTRTRRSRER